jgi:uncharacterized heparinase superfamily protein
VRQVLQVLNDGRTKSSGVPAPQASKLALYFHTIRHLRPIQVAAVVWGCVHQPPADLRPAPGRRMRIGPYAVPVPKGQKAEKEWTCCGHYFTDLNAHDSPARTSWQRQLLERWVQENPPGPEVGWEPNVLSQRLVNWTKWTVQGNVLPQSCHASMAVQARWLSDRLEYRVPGCHLFANAQALVHAGLYFEGAEADRWYNRGISIINRQVREQVLADGGHFELSTMYHAVVLEGLLDVMNLLRAYGRQPNAEWHATVARMRRWLLAMTHPDGDIAFFNDAVFGNSTVPAALEAYATRLGLKPPPPTTSLEVLGDSGYVRVALGPAFMICDCAAVGASYLPGHGHADALSFELSLAGQRVFVNSGVSDYYGADRQRQRGTAAHNTVIINGQNSSEVWSAFQVARRAHACLNRATLADTAIVEGCHDGYLRLPGRNRHTRRWTLDRHALRIEDRLTGDFLHAEARLHLHPSISVRINAQQKVVLQSGGRQVATVAFDGAAAVQIGRGTWHPRFGVSEENRWIGASFTGSTLISHISWSQLR